MRTHDSSILNPGLPCFCCAAIVIWATACAQSINSSYSSITGISVYATPGKLMALYDNTKPAEKIIMTRNRNSYVLTVCINVRRDDLHGYTEDSCSITQADWDSTINIVERLRLIGFVPVVNSKNAIDYGTKGYSLEGSQHIEHAWSQPISNSEVPEALFKRLSQLAKQRIPHLAIHYF